MWTRCRTRAFSWLQHGLKPVIFLIDNVGYTIERAILGKTARYNDVANWAYAQVFRPGTTARSCTVSTVEELKEALAAPHDAMTFSESIMVPFDASDLVLASGKGMASTDYGSRGPRSRPGMHI